MAAAARSTTNNIATQIAQAQRLYSVKFQVPGNTPESNPLIIASLARGDIDQAQLIANTHLESSFSSIGRCPLQQLRLTLISHPERSSILSQDVIYFAILLAREYNSPQSVTAIPKIASLIAILKTFKNSPSNPSLAHEFIRFDEASLLSSYLNSLDPSQKEGIKNSDLMAYALSSALSSGNDKCLKILIEHGFSLTTFYAGTVNFLQNLIMTPTSVQYRGYDGHPRTGCADYDKVLRKFQNILDCLRIDSITSEALFHSNEFTGWHHIISGQPYFETKLDVKMLLQCIVDAANKTQLSHKARDEAYEIAQQRKLPVILPKPEPVSTTLTIASSSTTSITAPSLPATTKNPSSSAADNCTAAPAPSAPISASAIPVNSVIGMPISLVPASAVTHAAPMAHAAQAHATNLIDDTSGDPTLVQSTAVTFATAARGTATSIAQPAPTISNGTTNFPQTPFHDPALDLLPPVAITAPATRVPAP